MRIITVDPVTGFKFQQESQYHSTWSHSNEYLIPYIIQKMYSKEIWIYASCFGVRVKYYTSFYTDAAPYIDRIEPYLPTIFDSHFRQSPYFRVNIDFMWAI